MHELAISDFNQAIQLKPDHVDAFWLRGRAHLETTRFKEAISDFDKALMLQPKLLSAILGRARAHEMTRDYAKSLADFELVLAMDEHQGVAVAGRDRIKLKMGAVAEASVQQRGRVALVIGNSRYGVIDNLANAERDARLVADSLRRSGFENVELLIDGSRDRTISALMAFSRRVAAAEWAVIYYAGHGVELDGSNYLVPVDVQFEVDSDIPKESIALDELLNAVGAAGKLRLVILDACRENPLVAQIKGTEGSSSGKGLARIEPESGTVVAFATKHGHLATDGSGQNSPFAESLVRRMNSPGLEISQLFRLVHDDVYAATNKKQEPFTYGQLSAREFYFKSR
jgi:tetratricopeptide (TPR) repeat protein